MTIIPDIIKEDEEYAFVFIAIKKIRIAAKIPKKIEKRGVAFNKIIDALPVVFLAKIELSLTKFNEDEKKEERNIAKEQPKEAPEEMPSV